MNKDQVNGRVEEAKGAVKQAAGKLVGNERLQAEGTVEKSAGEAQAVAGDTKAKVADFAKKAIDR